MGMVLSIVQFSSSKLQEYIDNPENFETDLRSLEDDETNKPVDLDKSWEAIHYILTGHKIGTGQPPLSLAIYGQQFFDEEQDLGMGPASYLTPEQVKEIDSLIGQLDESFLKEKYRPEEMDKAGVYPRFWKQDPSLFDYVKDNFFKLQQFYRAAASKGNAIASYLS